jgi:hypothetical protein
MITNDKGFIPHAYQMRAVRILLGWDQLAACRAASLTPDELALVEMLPLAGKLDNCSAERRAFAMIKYCGAAVASGAILRQHVCGDTLYFDAMLSERPQNGFRAFPPNHPQDDFQLEDFLPTSLQVRAAAHAVDWSDGGLRCMGFHPGDLREYAVMTRHGYLDARRNGDGNYSASDLSVSVNAFVCGAAKEGVYFIDPARHGLPGWGLRFREVMARD